MRGEIGGGEAYVNEVWEARGKRMVRRGDGNGDVSMREKTI